MTDSLAMRKRAVFLDKDGTLIEDVPYNVEPARMALVRQAGPALQLLQRMGYRLLVVTNQSGGARGLFPAAALGPVRARLTALLMPYGVALAGFYYCPHHEQGAIARYAIACTCRKPMPGLIARAATEHGIDLARSWMIGDILNDIEAGHRAGCRSALIDNGNETEWQMTPLRLPDIIAPDLYTAARRIAGLAAGQASRLSAWP